MKAQRLGLSFRRGLLAISKFVAVAVAAAAAPEARADEVAPDALRSAALAPPPNELALDLAGSASRVAHETMIGVRYESVDGAWALGLEPRAGLGVQDGATTDTVVTSLGLDATADRRFPVGPVTFLLGGGAGGEYVWQRFEPHGSAASTTNHALAVGPIATAAVRLRIYDCAWIQLGARGGLELMNVGGTFGPVATIAAGWAGGVSF